MPTETPQTDPPAPPSMPTPPTPPAAPPAPAPDTTVKVERALLKAAAKMLSNSRAGQIAKEALDKLVADLFKAAA